MLVNKDAYQRETLTKWPIRLPLNVLLYVWILVIAIFKIIVVFYMCNISVLFDNMLNKIKSNQTDVWRCPQEADIIVVNLFSIVE